MTIKHLEVKRAYYADPENVVIQYRHSTFDDWTDVVREPKWTGEGEYRIKPKTTRIGDIDVPEPVRKKLEMDQRYFIADPTKLEVVAGYRWSNEELDNTWLSRGLIHLTSEAAKLHAKALILVSGGKIDE